MEKTQDEVVEAAASTDGGQEMPFILQFLEPREGAMAGTTSGTYPDIDASDVD